MNNVNTHRCIVALKLPKQNSLLLSVATVIVISLTGNKAFPNPDPPVATLKGATDDFANAENAVKGGSKTAVAGRNQKRKALLLLLEQSKGYVQRIADADPDHAQEIILSAGMGVRKVPVRTKRSFAAKPGTLSGSVEVSTGRAANRASYEWQYSADGGKTWLSAPPSLQSKTVVTGLQAGVTYAFRFRVVTKSGPADWSEATSVLVR